MARVTVEDCVKIVPNRFDLILKATNRAKALANGAPITLDRDNDKNTIVALREIEESKIDLTQIEENIISDMQRFGTQETQTDNEPKAIEAEGIGEQLYNDAEFEESDSFQVVEDPNI